MGRSSDAGNREAEIRPGHLSLEEDDEATVKRERWRPTDIDESFLVRF